MRNSGNPGVRFNWSNTQATSYSFAVWGWLPSGITNADEILVPSRDHRIEITRSKEPVFGICSWYSLSRFESWYSQKQGQSHDLPSSDPFLPCNGILSSARTVFRQFE